MLILKMEFFFVWDCYVVDDEFVVKMNILGEDDCGFDCDVFKQFLGLLYYVVFQGVFSFFSFFLGDWGGYECMQVFVFFYIFLFYCGKLVVSYLFCF